MNSSHNGTRLYRLVVVFRVCNGISLSSILDFVLTAVDGMGRFEDLPDDVVIQIVSRVNAKQGRRLAILSKELRQSIYRVACEKDINLVIKSEAVKRSFQRLMAAPDKLQNLECLLVHLPFSFGSQAIGTPSNSRSHHLYVTSLIGAHAQFTLLKTLNRKDYISFQI